MNIDEELVIEYAVVRRELPGANPDELSIKIIERLSEEQCLTLAADAELWATEPADPQTLARQAVRNFVLAMETDPDDPDQV
ncbi:MAG: hypothetical protein ACR2GH_02455 [Pseudonocardia sp.]